MAPYRRQETRDLAPPEPLSVAPARGDTYVQPERPVQNDDMARLGQSLSAFSGALAGLYRRNEADLKRQEAERKKLENDQAKEAAARYIASSSSTELAQGLRNGTVPYYANPVANGAYQAAVGINVGNEFSDAMKADFGPGGTQSLLNPDGTPVDIDQLIADRAKGYMDRIPTGTPHGAENFQRSVVGLREQLLKEQQGQIARHNADVRGVTISTGFRNVLNAPDMGSLTPDQVAERVRQAKAELAGSVNGATWAEMNDSLMGVLKTSLSDGRATPQAARNVLAILDAPGKDVKTGQALPAFSQDPKYVADAQALRADANRVLGKDWEAQQKDGLFKQAQAALTRGDGSFDAVQDIVARNPFTGEMKTFGAKEIKDGAVTFQAQSIRSQVAKQFQGQPQSVINGHVFAAQAEQFVRNGVENPEWKGYLHSAIQSASNTTSLTNPDEQQRTEQAANLYEALRTRSPAYVNNLLDAKDRDFYDSYHLLRKMGKTGQEAIEGASRAIDPDSANGDQIKAAYQEINDAVKGLRDPQSGYMPWNWKSNPVNLGSAQTEITRRAQLLVRTQGVSAKDAVKAAAASIGEEVPVINGQAQFNRSSFLSIGKEPVVNEVLNQVYKQFPNDLKAQGIDGPGNLSIRFENGIYRVINAATGAPLYSVNGDKLTFTDRDLRKTDKAMSLAANAKIIDDRKQAAQSRDAGLKLFEGTPAEPIFDLLTNPQKPNLGGLTGGFKALADPNSDVNKNASKPVFPWFGE